MPAKVKPEIEGLTETCTQCGRVGPPFSMHDRCSGCATARVRLWRRANPKKFKKWMGEDWRRAWKRDRVKVLARHKLQHAVRMGRIVRPDSCEACGESCTPHGHHDDYRKPLHVQWFCSACHDEVHATMKGR